MSQTIEAPEAQGAGAVEHVDVLIVGAGISGIGAAHHLTTQRPGTSFLVLDALESFGGTWWTHRYPGVRSDSDLYTFGYRFKPWVGPPIATAQEILTYMGEVIDEGGFADRIRYRHRITAATWSSEDQRWTIEATRLDTGEELAFTCGFLWMCQGYYRHQEGYTPDWEGLDDFQGTVVHPQTWPDDLDLTGKRVVVIGSGATAATLIPAIAERCAHVTMLQRSPTFFIVRPNANDLADTLRELDIPEAWTHEIVRRKILKESSAITQAAQDAPELVRQMILDGIRQHLPEGFDVDKHFNPSYRPWQQRIAVLLDDSLFKAISAGNGAIVTDTIDRFTPTGIKVSSGEEIPADVVITATGFNLSVFGDIPFVVDGEKVEAADTVAYKGVMFTKLPNLAYVFGYFRASWTLRADLIADFVCKLLAHMEQTGAKVVVPTLRDDEADMPRGPWVDPENFNPGYLMRSMHLMPRQGDREPWIIHHDYAVEKDSIPGADLTDGTLRFT